MNRHWTLALVAALVVALVSPAFAATPLTPERHQDAVEKVAPPFATVPGRTLCVCQGTNDFAQDYVGYLNSFTNTVAGIMTVNIVCAFPAFLPGLGVSYCSTFQVIK